MQKLSIKELLRYIKELEDRNMELLDQTLEDSLTGLGNKRCFNIKFETLINSAKRDKKRIVLILFDLDNFKSYNDTYGHVAGDECLKKIAKATSEIFNRGTDVIARWGGEEFVIAATDCKDIATMADRLRQAIFQLNIPHTGSSTGRLSISQGVYAFVPDKRELSEYIEETDKLMYTSKKNGKDKFTITII